MDVSVGSTVQLFCNGSKPFEGEISAIDSKTGRISLSYVVDVETRKKLASLMQFFTDDIEKLLLVEKPNAPLIVTEENKTGSRISLRKSTPSHLKKLKHISPSELILKSGGDSENSTESSGTDDLTLKYKPNVDYMLLDKDDELFGKAMKYISTQTEIGLAFEGIQLGRKGKLCFIQIATQSQLFIFDVLQLGSKVFELGLKTILEDTAIMKIMHDCRFVSDMLQRQYDVKLKNIFDTQVVSVLVYKLKHGGDLPVYVQSLSVCIFTYLKNVPVADVFVRRVREERVSEDQAIWAKRPAPRSVLDAAVKNVKHLGLLRVALMHEYMTDAVEGVGIYLRVVSETNDLLAQKALNNQHELPAQFKNIPSYVMERKSEYIQKERSEEVYDSKGFRWNTPEVSDPRVKLTMDGCWYRASGNVLRRRSPDPPRHRGRASRHKSPVTSAYKQQQQQHQNLSVMDMARADAAPDTDCSPMFVEHTKIAEPSTRSLLSPMTSPIPSHNVLMHSVTNTSSTRTSPAVNAVAAGSESTLRGFSKQASSPLVKSATIEEGYDYNSNKVVAPNTNSPHAVTSPSHAVTSPSHVVTSPSHVVTSPSHVVTSPSHVVTAPSHAVTTQHHTASHDDVQNQVTSGSGQSQGSRDEKEASARAARARVHKLLKMDTNELCEKVANITSPPVQSPVLSNSKSPVESPGISDTESAIETLREMGIQGINNGSGDAAADQSRLRCTTDKLRRLSLADKLLCPTNASEMTYTTDKSNSAAPIQITGAAARKGRGRGLLAFTEALDIRRPGTHMPVPDVPEQLITRTKKRKRCSRQVQCSIPKQFVMHAERQDNQPVVLFQNVATTENDKKHHGRKARCSKAKQFATQAKGQESSPSKRARVVTLDRSNRASLCGPSNNQSTAAIQATTATSKQKNSHCRRQSKLNIAIAKRQHLANDDRHTPFLSRYIANLL